MSVTSVLNALETNVSATLGAGYKRANHTYEPEKNSSREDNSYAIGVSVGSQASGVNKAVTMETEFFITIYERYVNRTNDQSLRSAIKTVHDKIEDVYVKIVNNKLGINNVVLTIQNLSFDEPVIDESLVSVTCRFNVLYRRSTVA